jgi:hypothetical protein
LNPGRLVGRVNTIQILDFPNMITKFSDKILFQWSIFSYSKANFSVYFTLFIWNIWNKITYFHNFELFNSVETLLLFAAVSESMELVPTRRYYVLLIFLLSWSIIHFFICSTYFRSVNFLQSFIFDFQHSVATLYTLCLWFSWKLKSQ